jgi:hypothetical protein
MIADPQQAAEAGGQSAIRQSTNLQFALVTGRQRAAFPQVGCLQRRMEARPLPRSHTALTGED